MLELQMGIKSPLKRKMYKTIGGTPFLDMNYTVFGEVESGLEIIDKIASVPTAPATGLRRCTHVYRSDQITDPVTITTKTYFAPESLNSKRNQ